MARGKLKYRDVVGGKSKKGRKDPKKKIRPRKTYSLYQRDNKNTTKKRKLDFREEEREDDKRQKVEEQQPEVESSESEDELEDHMKQLRASLSTKFRNKELLAIESSEDSSTEEESDNLKKQDNIDINKDPEDTTNLKLSTEIDDDDDNNDEGGGEISESDEKEIEIGTTSNEEGDDNFNDPFVKHVCYELHENALSSLQNVPVIANNSMQHWPTLGKLLIEIPKYELTEEKNKNVYSIEEQKKFAPPGSAPTRITNEDLVKPENLFIKSQIIENLSKANKSLKDETLFTDLQREMFSVINNYQDLYYCQRSFSNAEEIRFVYCLHTVNHILKTRLKVVHHNARLSKKEDVPDEFRDQGLVRPKVMFVVQ
jgi:U3 small nucleolar RNA-associated protein 25